MKKRALSPATHYAMAIYYTAIVFTMMQPPAISGRTNPICRHGFTAETVVEPLENPGESG